MSSKSSLFAYREDSNASGGELLLDYRQRRVLEERERAAQKFADAAEQSAASNSADLRIRAWEKVHQLRIPSDPTHRALRAIAEATQLTLAEVLDEQRARSLRRASAGA